MIALRKMNIDSQSFFRIKKPKATNGIIRAEKH